MSYNTIGPSRDGGSNARESAGNDILRGMNERVNRAEVICRESEVIATDTLGELANQRETLTRTRDQLNDANRDLGNTNSTLKTIHRRLIANKLVLIVIILMELVIIGCQVYLKFLKHS